MSIPRFMRSQNPNMKFKIAYDNKLSNMKFHHKQICPPDEILQLVIKLWLMT